MGLNQLSYPYCSFYVDVVCFGCNGILVVLKHVYMINIMITSDIDVTFSGTIFNDLHLTFLFYPLQAHDFKTRLLG